MTPLSASNEWYDLKNKDKHFRNVLPQQHRDTCHKVLRKQVGRQLTSVLERGPGTEHTHTRTKNTHWTHTHTLFLTSATTHTYSNPLPAATNHWTISCNPPPACAAALNIQTNCPSSSARCRKRHKARADRWAGPGGLDLERCCVAPGDRMVLSRLLSDSQPAGSLQILLKEVSCIDALKSHNVPGLLGAAEVNPMQHTYREL